MPATPAAAALYVFLLIPGLIFLVRMEAHRPKRERSVFRETATVVFASVACAAAVLVLLLLISIFYRPPLDWFVAFTANPASTFVGRPRVAIIMLLAFLLVASIVAALAASEAVHSFWNRKIVLLGTGSRVQQGTPWETVFEPENKESEVFVGVQLKSGTWIQGTHAFHSDVEVENGDRSLVLQSPLKYRHGDEAISSLDDIEYFVVQPSEIEYILAVERTRETSEAPSE